MKIRARRVQPIREGAERPLVMGIVPGREELRRFLLEASRHRFGPVGVEGVIISSPAYDIYRPKDWVRSESLVRQFGYAEPASTAWPKLVIDLTGLRVASQKENYAATRHWARTMDVPLKDDETGVQQSDQRSGLPAALAWRDVRAWDCRSHSYVVVGRQSVWSLK